MSHEHAAHDTHSHGHGTDEHHHGGLAKYLAVGGALFVLTAISFAVGSSQTLMQDAPQVGRTMMIAVSCAKAMLVMLFFMHLIWEANWKYVLTVPASIMSLFLMLMLVPDVGQRWKNYSEERRLYAPDPAETVSHSESEQAGDQHAQEPEARPVH